jgi:hypothetical protein
MNFLGRLALVAGLCVIAGTALFASARAAVVPVSVKQCFVTPPKPLSKLAGGTQIDYVIHGRKAAKSITFHVVYRNAQSTYSRGVTDVGMFSPGIEIKHHFSLFSDVVYGGQTVRACVPVEVKWADSTVWLAPAH